MIHDQKALVALATEMHGLLKERDCTDADIVHIGNAVMFTALMQMPRHLALEAFQAVLTTTLDGMGFEGGRRWRP